MFRELQKSRTASTGCSSISSTPLSPRLNVKLVTIPSTISDAGVEEVPSQLLIFVRYQKVILVPNFNIYSLLQIIDPNLQFDTVELSVSEYHYR